MITDKNKLGLGSLIALSMGSMLGAGLFALPQNVAASAGVSALLLAWLITFGGMLALARVFQNLSLRASHLDAGIYSYAKATLGNFMGFSSAWGYWLSIMAGNIGYLIMISAACATFFPTFGDGTTLSSLLLSSAIVWSTTLLCLRGVKTATAINNMVTLLKVLPIMLFILIIAVEFKLETFTVNILQPNNLGSITQQIKNTMLVTVWVFIGIEGANVFSSRAQRRKDIGRATVLSFLLIFLMLFCISILPFGILSQATLANLPNPSTGSLLQHVNGHLSEICMNVALILMVLGAFLSWTMMAAEVPLVATKNDGLFPQIFALVNHRDAPAGALVIGALCQQLYLVLVYAFKLSYLESISIATAMIIPPYWFAALYAIKFAVIGKGYENNARDRWWEGCVGVVAVIYGAWLLYAAGKYLILASILYTLGIVVFALNKLLRKQQIFGRYELLYCLILVVGAGISICLQ